MKQILCLTMILLIAAQIPAQKTALSETRPLVFTGVTVIDISGGKLKSGTTVIVSGNRITNVGKKVKIPKDAQIIDAGGKFLIPGLWDMHAHSFTDNGWEWFFPLLITNGVTGVRELGTRLPFERINQMRRETLEGKILGPRYGAVTARVLDGTGSQILPQTVVETPEFYSPSPKNEYRTIPKPDRGSFPINPKSAEDGRERHGKMAEYSSVSAEIHRLKAGKERRVAATRFFSNGRPRGARP